MTKRVEPEVIAKLYVWLDKHHDSLRNDTKSTAVKAAEIASKEIGGTINAKLIERATKRLGIPPFWKRIKSRQSAVSRLDAIGSAVNALEERVKRLEELLK